MTTYFLKRLEVEGFRGINNDTQPLSLSFREDAVNSIFAANGTGKSSLFDAMCYAIRGSVQKLEGLPAAENACDYYSNRFHSTRTATIRLEFTSDDCSPNIVIEVKRDASGQRTTSSPSGHADPEQFLKSLDHDLVLLDHTAFMKFVDDSPLNRGRTFSALLGLSTISGFRQALETLANQGNLNTDFQISELEQKITTKKDDLSTATATLRATYKALLGRDLSEPVVPTTVASQLTAALKAIPLLASFFQTHDLLSVDLNAVRRHIRETEGCGQRERLTRVIQDIATLQALLPAASEATDQADLKQAMTERDNALAATGSQQMANLFDLALEVVGSDEYVSPDVCPVCDTDIHQPLASFLLTKKEPYALAEQRVSKLRTRWNSSTWVKRWRSLEGLPLLAASPLPTQCVDVDRTFRAGHPSLADLQTAIDCLAELERRRLDTIDQLTQDKTSIEASLPPSLVQLTQQIEQASQARDALRTISNATAALATLTTKLETIKKWFSFIRDASTTFAEAETRLSTAKTTALESRYQELYVAITCNPAIVPVLRRASGSENLHLRLDRFYGLNDLSATSLLPESYRNALAMAIFLSAAATTPRKARFMLLDDVTSSFDAGHQFQLMELLRTELSNSVSNPTGPQIILLSHDSLLEKYFDKMQSTAVWHHERLQGLPPQGALMLRSQSNNRLRQQADTYLQAGQLQEAEPLIRQYLEFKLLEIIRSVDVRVPLDFAIRDDRKMVDNALTAIKAAVTLTNQASQLVLTPQQLGDIDTLHVPALVANWVTHYATGVITNLNPYVLQNVLATIDSFAACFQYQCQCDGPARPRYYKSLMQKHCNC